VSAHDPHAMANARALLDDVELCTCPYEAAKDADAIVLLTEWSSFRALDIGRLAGTMRGQSFFDYRNAFKPNEILAHGLDYFGVGRPAQVHAPAE
jgi:UDPglucose 6-dehydrogenase